MTSKKLSRAGLLALAGAILLAIVLSLPTLHASYAEDAPATAPGAGSGRTRGGTAACDATPSRRCSKTARPIPATPPGCSPPWPSC